ncbi:MAG: hypothetical protein ACYTBJ_00735 [Planctomycetota bacterium]|jgi:hypothetical protein
MRKCDPDSHIGFCMDVYDPKTCDNTKDDGCLMEKECLELRDSEAAKKGGAVERK